MRALFDDGAILHHHHAVHPFNAGQPVGNEDGSAPAAAFPEGRKQRFFRQRIEHGAGFIQNCDGRAGGKNPRRKQALRLAAGGVPAVRVEFPRNRARWREPRKPRAIQRFAHGFFAFDAACAHIFGNAEGIQARILKRHGELRAQGIELVGAIGPSIQENLARLWIVQPQKQLYERGFARAVFAHQRDAFSPVERERNARERGALCAGIGEPYIL